MKINIHSTQTFLWRSKYVSFWLKNKIQKKIVENMRTVPDVPKERALWIHFLKYSVDMNKGY